MQNDVWARDIYNQGVPRHLAWVGVPMLIFQKNVCTLPYIKPTTFF